MQVLTSEFLGVMLAATILTQVSCHRVEQATAAAVANDGSDQQCLPKRDLADPENDRSYQVASTDYNVPNGARFGTFFSRVYATLYYPTVAQNGGQSLPANAKLPLVVMLHGNHANVVKDGKPIGSTQVEDDINMGATEVRSDLGFAYMANALAASGIVVMSINANDLNGSFGPRLVNERAQLILAHLSLLQQAPANLPAQVLAVTAAIDFQNVAFLGHSRGAEAVVMAAMMKPPGVQVKGVLSAAPTDYENLTPVGVPLFMILPSADGDLGTLPGLNIYDRAVAASGQADWFKAQHVIYGANHSFFNSAWTDDIDNGGGHIWHGGDDGQDNGDARLTRTQQEDYLSKVARVFFDQVFGRDLSRAGVLSGRANLASLRQYKVLASYSNNNDYVDSAPQVGTFDRVGRYYFGQTSQAYNGSFYDDLSGYVAVWSRPAAKLTVPLQLNLSGAYALSLRLGQVAQSDARPDLPLQIELVDQQGQTAMVGSEGLATTLPAPYERRSWQDFGDDPSVGLKDVTKTLLGNIIIPVGCITEKNPQFSLQELKEVRLEIDAPKPGALAIGAVQMLHR